MKQSHDYKSTTDRTGRGVGVVCRFLLCSGLGVSCVSPQAPAPENTQKAEAVGAALESAAGSAALKPEMPVALPAPMGGRFDMVAAKSGRLQGGPPGPPAGVEVITWRGQFSPGNLETIEAARRQMGGQP
jgi:hypothetical protein